MGGNNSKINKIDEEQMNANKFVKAFNHLIEIKENIEKLEKNKPLKVYLINASSIPKFKDLIKKYKKTLEKMGENETIEKSLQIEFANYETGNSIEVIHSFKNCEELKKKENEKNNEFIIANKEILEILRFEKYEYDLEIINVDNVKMIKFPACLRTTDFGPKDEECLSYKFEDKIKNPEISIIRDSSKSSMTIDFNNSAMKKIEEIKNININDTLDLFPLFYCLSNINLLVKYFSENKVEIIKPKNVISIILSQMMCELECDNKLKDQTKFLSTVQCIIGNDKNNYGCSYLINFLYNQIHNELNERKLHVNNNDFYFSGIDLTTELFHLRNLFEQNNKSIISDNFYFEFININRCINCQTNLYNCTMKNQLTFDLDKVLNFKLKKEQNFENIGIYDCFSYLINNQKNFICQKCNNYCTNSSYSILNSLPEIFTIILDRKNKFENGIEFGLDVNIDLKNYLYKWNNIEEKNTKFELIGMLTYIRNDDDSGHTAIYKSAFDNKWYFYKKSNKNIELIDNISDVYIGLPYLLFYQRKR